MFWGFTLLSCKDLHIFHGRDIAYKKHPCSRDCYVAKGAISIYRCCFLCVEQIGSVDVKVTLEPQNVVLSSMNNLEDTS